MPFTSIQRSLVFTLLGTLVLSLLAFRSELFWELGWPGVWLYNLLLPVGMVGTGYYAARLCGLRGVFGVGVLGAAEVASLLLVYGIIVRQPRNLPKLHVIKNLYYQVHNTIQYDTSLSRYDPELGYLYKSSVRSDFKNWEFGPHGYFANSLGLRDDEASARHPVVIALGDSFTTGWGVGQHEMFANRLEQLAGVKVLNAGVSSYGTVREGLLLRKLPRDSCRLVIVQYCVNDLPENEYWTDSLLAGKRFKPSFDREAYRKRQIQNAAGTVYVPFKFVFEISKKALKYLVLPPEQHDPAARNRADAIPDHVRFFSKGVRLIRQYYQGNILVISTSNSKKIDTEFIEQARRHVSEDSVRGVYFLNVAGSLAADDNYVVDGHYTASGHRNIARHLHAFIEENNLLPTR